jgi:hypothetical protein
MPVGVADACARRDRRDGLGEHVRFNSVDEQYVSNLDVSRRGSCSMARCPRESALDTAVTSH